MCKSNLVGFEPYHLSFMSIVLTYLPFYQGTVYLKYYDIVILTYVTEKIVFYSCNTS